MNAFYAFIFFLIGFSTCDDLFEEVRDAIFLAQADALVAQLAEKLSLLPPELRTPFHTCMRSNVVVERVGECMREAHQAATTTATLPSLPSSPSPLIEPQSTNQLTPDNQSNTVKNSSVERARVDFKNKLAALRSEMRKAGRQSASFHEAMAEITSIEDKEDSIDEKKENRLKEDEIILTETTTPTTATTTPSTTMSSTTVITSTITSRRIPPPSRARYMVKSARALTSLSLAETGTASPVASMSQLILSFLHPNMTSAEEDGMLERHEDITREARQEKTPSIPSHLGSPVQFFDVDLGRSHQTPDFQGNNLPLTKETYELINGLAKAKNDQIQKKEFSLLSPKIASLVPESNQKKGLLSPSIFALYENSNEEQILPIPKVLKDLGLHGRERKKVMEVALELAGARKIVSKNVGTTTMSPEYRL